MGIDLSNIFDKIGLEFDGRIGIHVHKKMKLPITVWYDDEAEELVLLDQTKLPYEVTAWRTKDWKKAGYLGIKGMIVRGSQAIGCAAGYALLLAANSFRHTGQEFMKNLNEAATFLKNTRPTAYPLVWAIDLAMKAAQRTMVEDSRMDAVVDAIKVAADYVLGSDLILNWFLRQEGMKHLEEGDIIMTHCNGGSLSSSLGGHALGMIEEAYAEGMDLKVVSKETRPRCQGYKLTVWELNRAGVPVIIVTDNMISSSFKRFKVSKIILGVDRVARDGAVANKIGSADIAYVAHAHRIPFYYATSYSTIDLETTKGANIPIEERKPEEITYFYRLEAADLRRRQIISEESLTEWPPTNIISSEDKLSKGRAMLYNPAFDITPPKLIKSIITDIGTFAPEQIKKLTNKLIMAKVRKRLRNWGVTPPE